MIDTAQAPGLPLALAMLCDPGPNEHAPHLYHVIDQACPLCGRSDGIPISRWIKSHRVEASQLPWLEEEEA